MSSSTLNPDQYNPPMPQQDNVPMNQPLLSGGQGYNNSPYSQPTENQPLNQPMTSQPAVYQTTQVVYQQPTPSYQNGAQPTMQSSTITFYPTQMFCQNCNEMVTSEVTYKSGNAAIIIGLILCIFGFWCCACIPCCIDGMKDAQHRCPRCHSLLYVKSRM